MKITILTTNQLLDRAVRDNFANHDVVAVTDMAQATPSDLLVIDGASMTLMAVSEMPRDGYPRLAYLTQTEQANPPVISGLSILVSDGRPVSVVEGLRKLLVNMSVLRNVLTFWSPVAGTGVTTVALTAFKMLPDTYRALYLSLTDIPGVEFSGIDVDGSLSDILSRLVNRVLDVQELVNACTIDGNKHYLSGLSTIVDVPHYSVDDIKALLAMASGYYDIVIVDAGSGATMMSLAAMSLAAQTYVVTTQSVIAAERYMQLQRQVIGLVPEIAAERMGLIINKEDKDLSGRTERAYNLGVVGSLRVVDSANALSAEVKRSPVYDGEVGTGYRADMQELLREIYSAIGVADAQTAQKPKGLFAGLKLGR